MYRRYIAHSPVRNLATLTLSALMTSNMSGIVEVEDRRANGTPLEFHLASTQELNDALRGVHAGERTPPS